MQAIQPKEPPRHYAYTFHLPQPKGAPSLGHLAARTYADELVLSDDAIDPLLDCDIAARRRVLVGIKLELAELKRLRQLEAQHQALKSRIPAADFALWNTFGDNNNPPVYQNYRLDLHCEDNSKSPVSYLRKQWSYVAPSDTVDTTRRTGGTVRISDYDVDEYGSISACEKLNAFTLLSKAGFERLFLTNRISPTLLHYRIRATFGEPPVSFCSRSWNIFVYHDDGSSARFDYGSNSLRAHFTGSEAASSDYLLLLNYLCALNCYSKSY